MSRARTAMKFLTIGLIAGILFAPRAGEQTRQQLMDTILSPLKRDQ